MDQFGNFSDELVMWRRTVRVAMELHFTHRDVDRIRESLARLKDLRECIIESIVWHELEMALAMELLYIWTDDGRISYTVNEAPRLLTLRFTLVNNLVLGNGLNAAMVEHPERINWSISEIAKAELFEHRSEQRGPEFIGMRFIWEGDLRIEVAFRGLTINLSGSSTG
jgi:hypothetical protein